MIPGRMIAQSGCRLPEYHAQTTDRRMKLDVSFLPAYGAAFMLMFARIGTMLMLLPGLGEMSVPVRIRLSIALLLT